MGAQLLQPAHDMETARARLAGVAVTGEPHAPFDAASKHKRGAAAHLGQARALHRLQRRVRPLAQHIGCHRRALLPALAAGAGDGGGPAGPAVKVASAPALIQQRRRPLRTQLAAAAVRKAGSGRDERGQEASTAGCGSTQSQGARRSIPVGPAPHQLKCCR